MDAEEIRILKENCFAYLKPLLKQMIKRLPENMNIFKIYGQFSILKCGNPLSQTKYTVVREAIKNFMNPSVPLDVYETQWGKLQFINWNDYFDNDIPTNLLDFCQKFLITMMRQVHTTLKNYQ